MTLRLAGYYSIFDVGSAQKFA